MTVVYFPAHECMWPTESLAANAVIWAALADNPRQVVLDALKFVEQHRMALYCIILFI